MTSSVLLSSMGLQCKQSFVRPMFRFCLLANPILNTVLLYEMYRGAGEENFFAYVALGAGLMAVWSAICFSSAGDINRERYSGTLALPRRRAFPLLCWERFWATPACPSPPSASRLPRRRFSSACPWRWQARGIFFWR